MNEKLLLLQDQHSTGNQSYTESICPKLIFRKPALLLALLLISSLGFAQTGPVGINTGIELWLDASDLDADGNVEGASEGGLTGLVVNQWDDKSGNGNDLQAPGGFSDPEYIVTEAAFNNRAVVDFDPGEVLFNNISDWADDHTIFIVFQQQATLTAGAGIFASGDYGHPSVAPDDIFQIAVDTSGNNIAYQTEETGNVVQTIFGTQAAALAAPTLCSATRNGSNLITSYDNGLQSATLTTTSGSNMFRYYLNSDMNETSINDCLIAEVIVYSRVLTPSEMARIDSYLACKYGLTVTTSSPGGIDPCDVSLWMKADGEVQVSGSNVDRWVDQSRHGFDGTASGGQRPQFSPMDNNFNPSLSFDGTNDGLSIGTAANDGLRMGAGVFSLYTVAFVDDATDGVLFADRLCKDENGYLLQFNSVTKNWEFEAGLATGGAYSSNDSVNVKTANTTSDYALVNIKRSGINYTAKTNELGTGTGVTSSAVNYNSGATERWIGRQENSPCSANNFNGSVSEIIAVKADLTSTEDIQIQSYLGIKYGLSLDPSIINYLASDGTPLWDNTISSYWHDVAGIGRDDGSMLDQRISKSQHPTGIVTISNDADFTSANSAGTRTSLADGQFLMWGNNDASAAGGWTTASAPSGYAVLPEAWLIHETGAPGAVSVQVHVDDPDNDIPTFHGSLYLSYGSNPTAAVPVPMTLDSTGYWSISGIDFADGDFFTFAVKNELFVEFTTSFSNSTDESTLGGVFPNVVDSGIVNVPTSYIITTSGTGTGAGFATQGADYTYVNDTINVAPGDYSTPTVTPLTPLPVLIDDSAIEGAEVIEFSFIVNAGTVVGDANNSGGIEDEHNLTITDDDAYNVSIEKLTDGIENDAATGDATFRIFVVGGVNPTTITGDIAWTGGGAGGATGGADYDNSVTSFSFPPGTITQTINLSTGQAAYDDGLLEGTERIIGTISNLNAATGLAVTASAVDTAFIDDDEVTGILISIDTVNNMGTTEEAGSVLRFRVSLDGSVVNNSGSSIDGTIDYSGSTATPGAAADFIPVTTFSIPNGQNSTTFDITALSDVLVENTETVVPAITLTSGIGGVNPTAGSATAFITDEDTTGLTISIAAQGGITGVTEGSVTNVNYVVSLDNGKINGTGADITGTIDITGGVQNLFDYTIGGVTDFAIPDGSGSGIYSVGLVNDGTSESTETMIATIVSTNMGSPSGSNSVTLNVFDDDSGNTIIEIGSPTDTTESPLGTPFVSFEISIVAGGASASDITGTIGYGTGPTAAIAGTDFTAVTSYTIPAGQTSITVPVYIIDDFLIEPTEYVTANLTGTPSLGSYGNSSSTASLFDDDAANVQLVIDTVMSGGEGGQNPRFVVSIFNSTVNGSGTSITGNIAYGGTATNSASGDYTASGTFDIGNGEFSDTITAFINDESLIEYTETIDAVLTSTTMGTILVDSAQAFIYDNDFDSLSISIQSPVDGAEGGGDVSFTISIDGGYVNGLGVPLTGDLLFTGTATAGFDFSDFDTYSIPNGGTFVIRDLPVLDDQNLELQESVIATLSNPLIPGTHNPNFIADTAYIDDNDLPNAELRISATDGVEMPNPFDPVFIVSFVGGLQNETGVAITGTLTVEVQGTATDGADYNSVTTFSIENDSIQDRIPFPLIDDLIIEGDETIVVTLSTTSEGVIGSTNMATAKILDDDTDVDNDGLTDLVDPNVGNIDSDCDGIFDGCDVDADGDGVPDDGGIDLNGNGASDVFYDLFSIDQDLDGIKDTCDADADGNGTVENGPDENEDGLNDIHWPTADNDLDLLPDHVDPNINNIDTDGDGITDGADADVNGDGILDNGCDDDGDGIHNEADIDNNPGKPDNDNDGIIADWDMQDDILDGAMINYIVSPNNDGVNDVLVIPGIQVQDQHELMIFNRFGERVYSSIKYNNDWYGQINEGVSFGSDILPDGVYYYILDFRNGDRVVRGYIEIRH